MLEEQSIRPTSVKKIFDKVIRQCKGSDRVCLAHAAALDGAREHDDDRALLLVHHLQEVRHRGALGALRDPEQQLVRALLTCSGTQAWNPNHDF